MTLEYENLEKLAEAKEDENWAFRRFLKMQNRMSGRRLDQLVHEITDRVWKTIDCTACGRCCRCVRPCFSQKDQKILSSKLNISDQDFRNQYLVQEQTDDGMKWILKKTPCPFLAGNACSVYENRPRECREYPYLHKPEFTHRLIGMLERIPVCPIVFQVMEELKLEFGFHFHR
jgi:Fe-S-cluster containining protein